MIQVPKGQSPIILEQNAAKWNIEYCNAIKTWTTNGKKGKEPQAKYNKPPIKDAVIRDFHDKCAYCESYVTATYVGDIEHFKPKKKYCWLTHQWDNLLFSCWDCNHAKLDKFPNPEIINPTTENPETFFEYDFPHDFSVVKLKPLNKRAVNSINTMDLNRDKLSIFRAKRVAILVDILNKVKNDVPSEIIKQIIYDLTDADDEYAGMFRYLYKNNLI